MAIWKASTHLKSTSGLPKDDSVVDIFISKASASSTDFDNARDNIRDFFNTAAAGATLAVGKYLARDRDYTTNAARIDFYLVPSSPGPMTSPVAVRNFSLADVGTGTIALPDQVAVCSSFHADTAGIPERVGATRPAMRRRGRIFVGPLNSLALEEVASTTAPQTVSAQFGLDLILSTRAWLKTAMASDGFTFVVFSRVDWLGYPVIGGYVDDRFDTQRRRLPKTTGRQTWV